MNAELLVGSRILFCALTAIILGSYFRPEARFKWTPSLIAAGLMCSSAAIAVQGVLEWNTLILFDPQPQFAIYTFFVLLMIAWCRGDMAVLLDTGNKLRHGVADAGNKIRDLLRNMFPWWPW